MIIQHNALAQFRAEHPSEKIAYTGGVFDILHLAHLDLFEKLRDAGDITIVGVTPDSRATFRKGPTRPVKDQATRVALVHAMGDVDYAFISPDQPQPGEEYIGYHVLRCLRPDVFLSSDPNWMEDADWLAEQGTEVRVIPRLSPDISTTRIISHILELHGYPPLEERPHLSSLVPNGSIATNGSAH